VTLDQAHVWRKIRDEGRAPEPPDGLVWDAKSTWFDGVKLVNPKDSSESIEFDDGGYTVSLPYGADGQGFIPVAVVEALNLAWAMVLSESGVAS
jgi:hypothetical protein